MSSEAKWYVIHTYSGYENKVASDIMTTAETRKLQHMIQEVKVPTETVLEIKDNKERTVERKTYPGYVLIKMIVTDETWYIVRNTRGCTGFVGSPTEPFPLTEEEATKLGVELKSIELDYEVGDVVRISQGPLVDMTGTVTEINKETKIVKLNVSMFGRETPMELGINEVDTDLTKVGRDLSEDLTPSESDTKKLKIKLSNESNSNQIETVI